MTFAARLLFVFLLCAGHALCDFPLQGDFLAVGKNHRDPLPDVPWYLLLLAHSLIHAGMVWVITRNIFLALGELGVHAVIDFMKCEGNLTFGQDQAAHYITKLLWAVLL